MCCTNEEIKNESILYLILDRIQVLGSLALAVYIERVEISSHLLHRWEIIAVIFQIISTVECFISFPMIRFLFIGNQSHQSKQSVLIKKQQITGSRFDTKYMHKNVH